MGENGEDLPAPVSMVVTTTHEAPVVVTFSVKELLSDIMSKLDRMEGLLTAKVERLDGRVDGIDDRLKRVEIDWEHEKQLAKAKTAERHYLTPVRLTMISVVAMLISVVISVINLHL